MPDSYAWPQLFPRQSCGHHPRARGMPSHMACFKCYIPLIYSYLHHNQQLSLMQNCLHEDTYIPSHRVCHVTHTGVCVLISCWAGTDQPEVGGEERRRTMVWQLENSSTEGQGTLYIRNFIIMIIGVLVPAQYMHGQLYECLCLVTLAVFTVIFEWGSLLQSS